MAVSAAGAVCQVTVDSDQLLSATRRKSPPRFELLKLYRRSFALFTGLAPIPETTNLIRKCSTGLLSAFTPVVAPKFVVGDVALIVASATGKNVSTVSAAPAPGARPRRAQKRSSSTSVRRPAGRGRGGSAGDLP